MRESFCSLFICSRPVAFTYRDTHSVGGLRIEIKRICQQHDEKVLDDLLQSFIWCWVLAGCPCGGDVSRQSSSHAVSDMRWEEKLKRWENNIKRTSEKNSCVMSSRVILTFFEHNTHSHSRSLHRSHHRNVKITSIQWSLRRDDSVFCCCQW